MSRSIDSVGRKIEPPDVGSCINVKREVGTALKSFLIEVVVYAILVVGYYFLVLHLLGDWLEGLYEGDRRVYAGVALALMLGQGVLLEMLTRFLLGLVKPRGEGG